MKSKYVFWLIAAITASAIFISCAGPRSPKEKQIPETDTIEQVVAPYDKLIKRSMDIQKEYIPDSMPRSSLPQINSDTIHQAINY